MFAVLRGAAGSLRQLPEAAEAARLWRAAEVAAATPLLERAAQVVDPLPMPALRLLAHGALAQAHRALGHVEGERAAWERALAGEYEDGDAAPLRLTALHGAIGCALHTGDVPSARAWCAEATRAREALPLGAAEDTAWRAALACHELLADAADGGAPATGATGAVESVAFDEACRLLRGEVALAAGDEGAAAAEWEGLIASREGAAGGGAADSGGALFGGAVDGAELREMAARRRLGSLGLRRADAEGRDAAHTHLQAAVKVGEGLVGRPPLVPPDADGARHPLLLDALGALAEVYAERGDAISAEGLYTTAVDGLHARASTSAAHARLLLPTLRSYAALLSRLEWNGKPRTSDAARVSAQADALRDTYPGLLGDGGEDRPRGGIELWLEATLGVDYLAEL